MNKKQQLAVFKRCERLFKQGIMADLLTQAGGKKFLRLRSLDRSKYLGALLEKSGIDPKELKAREQLSAAFCSSLTVKGIDSFIKSTYTKERKARAKKDEEIVNELYKLRVFDWGGLHQNSLERTIVNNYIKKIDSYDAIERAIENDLQRSLRGYVLCSWYNHWASILIEDIFKDHPRVLPALGLIPKIDFFIDGCPYDLKVTYLPEGFISDKRKECGLRPELTLLKKAARDGDVPIDGSLAGSRQLEELWAKLAENDLGGSLLEGLVSFRKDAVSSITRSPDELIQWLYENQGVRRFDAANRIYIVLVNTDNFFEGWKMKRAMPLLKRKTKAFLDSRKRVGRKVAFSWEGTRHTVKSDLLLVHN